MENSVLSLVSLAQCENMSKEMKENAMILHIDADAFFVACEIARLPCLRGKPVIVGGERGIACAMSYEAKALGVTRGMPVFEIKKRFPQTVILPAHFDLYYAYQKNLVSFLRERFSSVEIYSIDECFIEVKEHELVWSDKALENLQKEIGETLGISYSLGLARTKTLAKIASKKRKPNGSFFMTHEREKDAVEDLPISLVWGIGRRTSASLLRRSIASVFDFIHADTCLLEKEFSLPVLRTRDELLGIKRIKMESSETDQKSLQVTRSFKKTGDIAFVLSELSLNIEKLARKLREKNLMTNKLSLWIKEIKDGIDFHHQEVLEFSSYSNKGSEFLSSSHSFFERMRALGARYYKGSGVYAHNLRVSNAVARSLFEDDSLTKELEILSMLSISSKHCMPPIVRASSLLALRKRTDTKEKEDKESFYAANLPYPYLGIAS